MLAADVLRPVVLMMPRALGQRCQRFTGVQMLLDAMQREADQSFTKL